MSTRHREPNPFRRGRRSVASSRSQISKRLLRRRPNHRRVLQRSERVGGERWVHGRVNASVITPVLHPATRHDPSSVVRRQGPTPFRGLLDHRFARLRERHGDIKPPSAGTYPGCTGYLSPPWRAGVEGVARGEAVPSVIARRGGGVDGPSGAAVPNNAAGPAGIARFAARGRRHQRRRSQGAHLIPLANCRASPKGATVFARRCPAGPKREAGAVRAPRPALPPQL